MRGVESFMFGSTEHLKLLWQSLANCLVTPTCCRGSVSRTMDCIAPSIVTILLVASCKRNRNKLR